MNQAISADTTTDSVRRVIEDAARMIAARVGPRPKNVMEAAGIDACLRYAVSKVVAEHIRRHAVPDFV